MAEGRCASIARYLLIILNLLFTIVGVLLIAVGIWLVASDDAAQTITDKLHLTFTQDLIHTFGYTIFGIGFCMFLIGFCGCCGSIRESAIMLGVHIIFMAVLLCGEVVAIIYVTLERSAIEAKLRDQLVSKVRNYTITNGMSNLDFIQAKFQCCGADNFTNYKENTYFSDNNPSRNASVPDSCCRTLDKTIPAQPINWDRCQNEAEKGLVNGTQLYSKGCFNILMALIEDNSAVLIGIASGILVSEVLGIALGIFLCRHRTDYDYYDD